MNKFKRRTTTFLHKRRPVSLLLMGYSIYVLTGFILLCLPVSQAQTGTPWLDHLFTATSAVSTTGLVSISPSSSYSFFGELVIIGLIQLGGLGYMTLGSFIMLAFRHRLDHLHSDMTRTAFVLPEGVDLARFIRSVITFTLVIESIGAAILTYSFAQAGVSNPVWNGVFHSISAFCTAGFSLFDNSMEDFSANLSINLTLGTLSFLGAIGFIVMSDWWMRLLNKGEISLTSKIILRVTLVLAVLGTLCIALTDPALQTLDRGERLMVAFFQTMTAMTTVGFNSYPIGEMGAASILLIIAAMIMGASPSGTGGGVKSTTIAIFFAAIKATFTGRSPRIALFGHDIPHERVHMAMATFGFYLGALTLGTFLLLLAESQDFLWLIFEAASAIGTVGLSLGATGDLGAIGQWIIIAMMFVGRLGPITVGIALFPRPADIAEFKKGKQDLAV